MQDQQIANLEQPKIIRYNTMRGEEVALNVRIIKDLFCDKATPAEALGFMRFCQAHNLNPFLRDAYLVKYKADEPAQFIVGYQVWLQVAERQPSFRGLRAGIIIQDGGGEIVYKDSLFYLPGDVVVGGWAEILIEGRENVRVEVPFSEYASYTREGVLNRFWKTKPGTMIQKVAIGQSCRLAYPSGFAGMYGPEEVSDGGPLPEHSIVIDGETGEVLGRNNDYPSGANVQSGGSPGVGLSTEAAPERATRPEPASATVDATVDEGTVAQPPAQDAPAAPRQRRQRPTAVPKGTAQAQEPPAQSAAAGKAPDLWMQVRQMVEADAHITWETFLRDELHFGTLTEYVKVGGSPEKAGQEYIAKYRPSSTPAVEEPAEVECEIHHVHHLDNVPCPECLAETGDASDAEFNDL